MDAQEICRQIFDLALEYSKDLTAPVSYINVEVGFNVSIPDDELWESFNKLRWDTDLSSAELFIMRRQYSGTADTSIRVVSITPFEDDEGVAPVITVKDGIIA